MMGVLKAWNESEQAWVPVAASPYTDYAPLTTNAQIGTSYTLALTDVGKIVELNNGSPFTLTVPHTDTVNFLVGTRVDLLQTGAGQVTVQGAGSVTVNGQPGLKIAGQWRSATLLKRAANTWVLIGALVA